MVSLTTRPARAPPACIDVRPFRMMTMFLPSSSSTFWLPRANPSPRADSSRNEITPQTMPNMVRKRAELVGPQVRPRLARGGLVEERASSRPPTAARRAGPSLRPLSTCVLVPLLTPILIVAALALVLGAGQIEVHRRVALRVVDDRRLGHDQRLLVLFEDDLRVGRHVGEQFAGRVVDRHLHLEGDDVVLVGAHRRDLRDLALELLVAERLHLDARGLAEAHRCRCRPRRRCPCT